MVVVVTKLRACLHFHWYRSYFPGEQRLECVAYNSAPSSVEVRIRGAMPLIPLHDFLAWTGTASPVLKKNGACWVMWIHLQSWDSV